MVKITVDSVRGQSIETMVSSRVSRPGITYLHHLLPETSAYILNFSELHFAPFTFTPKMEVKLSPKNSVRTKYINTYCT